MSSRVLQASHLLLSADSEDNFFGVCECSEKMRGFLQVVSFVISERQRQIHTIMKRNSNTDNL